MNEIKILVATLKKFRMPDESIYFPIHVGRELSHDIGYQGDNTGNNISIKNNGFCELTALYWAWKNLDSEYIGLCHYRRYFTKKGKFLQMLLFKSDKYNLILDKSEFQKLVKYDVIVSKEAVLNGNIWSHYKQNHYIKDLIEVKNIIKEKYPNYINSFETVMESNRMHAYNMFIMKKEDLNNYCSWLFDILFELEKRIDISEYDNYQKRVYGFLGERLFNVWLLNSNLNKKELDVINIESANRLEKIVNRLTQKNI